MNEPAQHTHEQAADRANEPGNWYPENLARIDRGLAAILARGPAERPLAVFDFDHTLYDGDSGSHLFKWLIERAWWRRLLAILVAPVATGAPPELARAILAFVAHEGVPVVGTLVGPKFGALGALRHCHHHMKMTMIRDAGFAVPVEKAYSDSSADLPLLKAARAPVVVNPKPARVDMFRRVLPPGTPILNGGCRERGGAAAS